MGNMEDPRMNFTKTVAIGAFLATSLVAGGAFAKGHSQGAGSLVSTTPGTNVHNETVNNSPARNTADGIRAQHNNARVFMGHPGRGMGMGNGKKDMEEDARR
jgi:hypothetical protein